MYLVVQGRETKGEPILYVSDILFYNGKKTLLNETLEKRKLFLEETFLFQNQK